MATMPRPQLAISMLMNTTMNMITTMRMCMARIAGMITMIMVTIMASRMFMARIASMDMLMSRSRWRSPYPSRMCTARAAIMSIMTMSTASMQTRGMHRASTISPKASEP